MLDSFLNDESVVEEVVLDGAKVEDVVEPAAKEPEKQEEVKQEDVIPETPAIVAVYPEKGFKEAMIDERRKRQELEKKLEEALKPKEPEKTFWEDPDAALEEVKAEAAKMVATERLNWSEMAARERYKDFDQVMNEFESLIKADPRLIAETQRHPDPATFAYQTTKKHLKLQEIGDPETYEERLTAKLKAELEKQYDTKLAERVNAAIAERMKIPSSLSGVQSTVEPEIDVSDIPLNKIVKR